MRLGPKNLVCYQHSCTGNIQSILASNSKKVGNNRFCISIYPIQAFVSRALLRNPTSLISDTILDTSELPPPLEIEDVIIYFILGKNKIELEQQIKKVKYYATICKIKSRVERTERSPPFNKKKPKNP